MDILTERPEFSPEYVVGIEQVDREHQRLFEIAGRVYDSFIAGDKVASANIHREIAELLHYTATHFASEEALMEAAGYPGLEAHKAQHRHLLSRARDMEMRVEIGEEFVPVELNRFVVQWLTEHILVNDKEFGKFIRSN